MNNLYNFGLSPSEKKEIRRIAKGKSYTLRFMTKQILKYSIIGLLSYSSYKCTQGTELPDLSSPKSGLEVMIENEEYGHNIREMDFKLAYGSGIPKDYT